MAIVAIYETQYFDDDGNPLAGGKLYAFAAGTSNPANIFSTAALTGGSEFPIPLVLDDAGRPSLSGTTKQMYMDAGSYDYQMDNASDVTIWTASAVPTIATVTS